MGKGNFTKSKVSNKNCEIMALRENRTVVFCTLVLLICSIIVRCVNDIANFAKNLFLSYSNLTQINREIKNEKIKSDYIGSNINDEMIGQTWISFSSISRPNSFENIYLVAWWDVMLSRNIWFYAKTEWYDRIFKKWNYNPLNEFKDCKTDNCLLFLNLESLFCEPDHDIQMWWFDFRSNPKNIETLQQYHQNRALLLALPNNHFMNWWFQWLKITKQVLADSNIFSVGAGFDKEESREIFSREENEIKICLWAYSYDWWSAYVRWWTVVWNRINENEIKSDLEKMKEMNCDAKIISLHRWAEYRFSPNSRQKNLAHNLIDAGADLILWGHSHIPWEFEIYNGKYIFYSLGNFIFDQDRWKRATGSEFNYFYDADLERNSVPTYISMLVWLNFQKHLLWKVDITLEQIEFSSTTKGLFGQVWEETRNNLLRKINLTNQNF